jgi:hypothetical protein
MVSVFVLHCRWQVKKARDVRRESVGLSLGPWVPSDNVSPLAPVHPTPITLSFLSQSLSPVLSRSKSLII